MSSPSSPTENTIIAPFDSVEADVVLRTVDGGDFHVLQAIMSIASPVFKGMFKDVQPRSPAAPDEDWKDNLPVVRVTETTRIVELLLSILLSSFEPRCKPWVPRVSLVDLRSLFEACRKYETEGARKLVADALITPRLLQAEPMPVFVMACRWKLQPQAEAAARWVLRSGRPSLSLHDDFDDDLDAIPASAIYHLESFYVQCCSSVGSTTSDLGWVSRRTWPGERAWDVDSAHTTSAKHDYRCLTTSTPLGSISGRTVRRWWSDYIAESGRLLLQKPHGDVVCSPELLDTVIQQTNDCSVCRAVAPTAVRKFAQSFAREVNDVVSKVHPQDAVHSMC